MTALPTQPCKLCGNPIVWTEGLLASGAPGRLPLDAKAPCYVARASFGKVESQRDRNAYVLHHAVCPALRRPTARKPGEETAEEEVTRLRHENSRLRDQIVVLESRLGRRS
jgi:hypothetical protein